MERFVRQQQRLLRPKPQQIQLSESRQWIRSLQVGDVIITDRDESLLVVRDYHSRKMFSMKDCCKVKRSHLKEPQTLKSCQEFDDCVEFSFANASGFSQHEFKRWKVVRPPSQVLPLVPSTSEPHRVSS
jgi:hypothetical protein